jgi:hypothetical protein
MIRRIAIGIGTTVVALALASIVVLRMTGAWGALFPSSDHDVTPPELPSHLTSPAILVFTKTNGFRHTEAIDAGVPLFERIAEQRDWSIFHTENGAIFNDDQLARFDAVVFHNASGDLLDQAQEDSFKRYLAAGGGFVGTHAAGDASHESWDWYIDEVIGSLFTAHIMGPQFQEALVKVEDASHPATQALPAEWTHSEEWYSWEDSPRNHGFHILATVDEASYEPYARLFGTETDLRMGDHPILWTRCIGRGRTLYSAMGHAAEAYETPELQALLEGAVAWAARVEGSGCDDEVTRISR